MSEWISVKKSLPDEEGWYFVLINRKPVVVLYRFPQWDRGWQTPTEWSTPTHWMHIPEMKDE